MAVLRKGFHWSAWLIGCLVSIVFGWAGWSAPPWAQAARYRTHGTFHAKHAVREGTLFEAQLAEETARLMMAQAGHRKKGTPAIQGPAQPLKTIQPQQTLKVETMKPGQDLQPNQGIFLDTGHPQQAWVKVESPQPTQFITKVESPQPTQAHGKQGSSQPTQFITKVESLQGGQPGQALKVESPQPGQNMKVDYFESLLQDQSPAGKIENKVEDMQATPGLEQPQQTIKTE
jgi:hypothetical protein